MLFAMCKYSQDASQLLGASHRTGDWNHDIGSNKRDGHCRIDPDGNGSADDRFHSQCIRRVHFEDAAR